MIRQGEGESSGKEEKQEQPYLVSIHCVKGPSFVGLSLYLSLSVFYFQAPPPFEKGCHVAQTILESLSG